MTDTPTPTSEGTTVARFVAAAMVIGGIAGVYFGWHFTATWHSGDPNILGTGWLLEAVFWTLRAIPGWVLFSVLAVLGALSLHGMALPSKDAGPDAERPATH
jgi:hypothetical protein